MRGSPRGAGQDTALLRAHAAARTCPKKRATSHQRSLCCPLPPCHRAPAPATQGKEGSRRGSTSREGADSGTSLALGCGEARGTGHRSRLPYPDRRGSPGGERRGIRRSTKPALPTQRALAHGAPVTHSMSAWTCSTQPGLGSAWQQDRSPVQPDSAGAQLNEVPAVTTTP